LHDGRARAPYSDRAVGPGRHRSALDCRPDDTGLGERVWSPRGGILVLFHQRGASDAVGGAHVACGRRSDDCVLAWWRRRVRRTRTIGLRHNWLLNMLALACRRLAVWAA